MRTKMATNPMNPMNNGDNVVSTTTTSTPTTTTVVTVPYEEVVGEVIVDGESPYMVSQYCFQSGFEEHD